MARVVRLGPPAGSAPSWAVAGWAEVDREHQLDLFGHDDLAPSAAARLAKLADRAHVDREVLLAVADDAPAHPSVPAADDDAGDPADVVGFVHLDQPRTDNTHLVLADLVVRPGARRRGAGTALWAAAERVVRASGRTVVLAWTTHPGGPSAGEVLVARTGVGAVPRDDAARFAVARGFALEQTERHSVLDVDPPRYPPLEAAAAAAAGDGYRLVQWADTTPPERLTAMAELLRRMSVDVPVGALALEEEAWDAARVRDRDAAVAARGDHSLITAAEHVPTGALVAYTELLLPAGKPAVAWRENTIVHGEHRGHRLGMLAAGVSTVGARRASRRTARRRRRCRPSCPPGRWAGPPSATRAAAAGAPRG